MKRFENQLVFDFDTCFGRGKIPRSLWKRYQSQGKFVMNRFIKETEDKQLGFFNLPESFQKKELLAPIKKAADYILKNFDNLVIIGIGGSSLGSRMLKNALAHRYHNELPSTKRKGVRLYFLENDDPDSFTDLLEVLDLKKTIFNVVSKSGTTAETACQFALIRDLLKAKLPKQWNKHLIFTTDPENGILRELSTKEDVKTIDIPQEVGGRYSVLTSVGLLPALSLKLDVMEMLKGAAQMANRCTNLHPDVNPALAGALVSYIADKELARNILVCYPYADQLQDWTEWFCQLWAESIGKAYDDKGNLVNVGTTPIKALGAIDQHSQSQLYMEGPNDKIFMFIRLEKFDKMAKFPPKTRMPKAINYLSGHSMQELIKAEQTATRFALGQHNRITYQVDIPKLNAHSLGQLIFWAESMTVLNGYLYGVNPFDQPGVELSKQFTYGLMGRSGFEKFREKIANARNS